MAAQHQFSHSVVDIKYDIATNATDVILNQSNQAISGGVLNLVDYQFVPHDENNV